MSTIGLYPEDLVPYIFSFSGMQEIKWNVYIRGFEKNVMVVTST